jgi:S1-C subfamily serine protease
VPRDSGGGNFAEPIASSSDVTDGESVFVIGHPEGLRFTLSTGIISRTDSSTIQMSALVSPGNSGGPVFDDKGELVAIVTSMVDKHGIPTPRTSILQYAPTLCWTIQGGISKSSDTNV